MKIHYNSEATFEKFANPVNYLIIIRLRRKLGIIDRLLLGKVTSKRCLRLKILMF